MKILLKPPKLLKKHRYFHISHGTNYINNFNYIVTLNKQKYQQFSSLKQSQEQQLPQQEIKYDKYLNPTDPILEQVNNEINQEKLDRERLSNRKLNILNSSSLKELALENYFTLYKSLENDIEGNVLEIPENYTTKKGVYVSHKLAPITEEDLLFSSDLKQTVLVSFYNKASVDYLLVNKLKYFLEGFEDVVKITNFYDFQGNFALSKVEFNDEIKASDFKFKYSYIKVNNATFFESSNNLLTNSKLNTQNNTNLLVLSNLNDFMKESKEERTLIISNLDQNMTRKQLIDKCSEYGSVIDINLPVVSKLSEKINQSTVPSTEIYDMIKKDKDKFLMKDKINNIQDFIKQKITTFNSENSDKNVLFSNISTNFHLSRINHCVNVLRELEKKTDNNKLISEKKISEIQNTLFSSLLEIKFYLSKLLDSPELADKYLLDSLSTTISNNSVSNNEFNSLEEFLQKELTELNSTNVANLTKALDLKSMEEQVYQHIKKFLLKQTSDSLNQINLEIDNNNKAKNKNNMFENDIRNTLLQFTADKNSRHSLLLNQAFIDKQLERLKFATSLSQEEKSKLKGSYNIDVSANLPQFMDYFHAYTKNQGIEIFDKYFSITKLYFEMSNKERAYVGRNLSKLIYSQQKAKLNNENINYERMFSDLASFLNLKQSRKLKLPGELDHLYKTLVESVSNVQLYYLKRNLQSGVFFSSKSIVNRTVSKINRLGSKIQYLGFAKTLNNYRRNVNITELRMRMNVYNDLADILLLALNNTPEAEKKGLEESIEKLKQSKFVNDYDTSVSSNINNFKVTPHSMRKYRRKYNDLLLLSKLPYPDNIDHNLIPGDEHLKIIRDQLDLLTAEAELITNIEDEDTVLATEEEDKDKLEDSQMGVFEEEDFTFPIEKYSRHLIVPSDYETPEQTEKRVELLKDKMNKNASNQSRKEEIVENSEPNGSTDKNTSEKVKKTDKNNSEEKNSNLKALFSKEDTTPTKSIQNKNKDKKATNEVDFKKDKNLKESKKDRIENLLTENKEDTKNTEEAEEEDEKLELNITEGEQMALLYLEGLPKDKNITPETRGLPPLTKKQIENALYSLNVKKEKLLTCATNLRQRKGIKNIIFDTKTKLLYKKLKRNATQIFADNPDLLAAKLKEIEEYFQRISQYTDYHNLSNKTSEFSNLVTEIVQKEIDYCQTTSNIQIFISNLSSDLNVTINKSNFLQAFSLFNVLKDFKKRETDFMQNNDIDKFSKFASKRGEFFFKYLESIQKSFKQDEALLNELQSKFKLKEENNNNSSSFVDSLLNQLNNLDTALDKNSKLSLVEKAKKIEETLNNDLNFYKLENALKLSSILEYNNNSNVDLNLNNEFNVASNRQKGYLKTLIDADTNNLLNNNSNSSSNVEEGLFRNKGYAFVTFSTSLEAKKLYYNIENQIEEKLAFNGLAVKPSFFYSEGSLNLEELITKLPTLEPQIKARELLEKSFSQLEKEIKEEKAKIENETSTVLDKVEEKRTLLKDMMRSKLSMEQTQEDEDLAIFSHHYLNYKKNSNSDYDVLAKSTLLDDSIFESKALLSSRLANDKNIKRKIKLAEIIKSSLVPQMNMFNKSTNSLVYDTKSKLKQLFTDDQYSDIADSNKMSLVYRGRNTALSFNEFIYGQSFQDNSITKDDLKSKLIESNSSKTAMKYYTNKEQSIRERFPEEKFIVKSDKLEKIVEQSNKAILNKIKYSGAKKSSKQSIKDLENDLLAKIDYNNSRTQMMLKERKEILEKDSETELSLTIQKMTQSLLEDNRMQTDVNDQDINKNIYEKYKREVMKKNYYYSDVISPIADDVPAINEEYNKVLQASIERRNKMKIEKFQDYDPEYSDTSYTAFNDRQEYELYLKNAPEMPVKAEEPVVEVKKPEPVKEEKKPEKDTKGKKEKPNKKNTQINVDSFLGSIKSKYEKSLQVNKVSLNTKNNTNSVSGVDNKELKLNDESTYNNNNNFNAQNQKLSLKIIEEQKRSALNSFIKENLSEEMSLIPSLEEVLNSSNPNSNPYSNSNTLNENNLKNQKILKSKQQEYKQLNDNKSFNTTLGIIKLKRGKLSTEEFKQFFESGIEENQKRLKNWLSDQDLDIIKKCDSKLEIDKQRDLNSESLFNNEKGPMTREWIKHIKEQLIQTHDIMTIENNFIDVFDDQYFVPENELLEHLNELSKLDNVNVEVLETRGNMVLLKREYSKKYKYNLEKILNFDFDEFYQTLDSQVNSQINNIDANARLLEQYNSLIDLIDIEENFSSVDKENLINNVSNALAVLVESILSPFYSDNQNSNYETNLKYNQEFLIGDLLVVLKKMKSLSLNQYISLEKNLIKMSGLFEKGENAKDLNKAKSVNSLVSELEPFMESLTVSQTDLLVKYVKLSSSKEKASLTEKYGYDSLIKNLINKNLYNFSKDEVNIVKYLLQLSHQIEYKSNKNINVYKNVVLENFIKDNITNIISLVKNSKEDVEGSVNNTIRLLKKVKKLNADKSSPYHKDVSKETIVMIKDKIQILVNDLKKLNPNDFFISIIPDPEIFIAEIQEQIMLVNLRLKYSELNKKDLVQKRLDEEDLYNSQLRYLENFTGKAPELKDISVPKENDLYEEIVRLKQLNSQRLKLIKQESSAIVDREFNRII